jgi:predicted TIM-barrel enzyme
VIVTGTVTGESPKLADVQEAKSRCHLPVFLGSGISKENIKEFFNDADGFIIGSSFKVDGLWSNTVDPSCVELFMNTCSRLR